MTTSDWDALEDRIERVQRVAAAIRPQLAGLEHAFVFQSKRSAELAVTRLSTCPGHRGVHHFAVFSEGRGVAFSATGQTCLLDAGILPRESDTTDKEQRG